MEALLSYSFIQRAIISGIFVAVACAVLGVFLILRRNAMFAHCLSHVIFAGVALGLILNTFPIGIALLVAILAALGILKIKERAGLYGDTAIGIFSSVGMAIGIILVSLSQNFNVDLFGYLFGEILSIETYEVWFSVGLACVVLLVIIINYQKFLYIAFDPESAKASGVKVEHLDTILTILTAVTVVLGMKIVGLIFVTALVVLPGAAALQLARSFKWALILSAVVSVISVIFGLFIAFFLDIPAAGTIVLFSFLIFVLFFVFKRKIK